MRTVLYPTREMVISAGERFLATRLQARFGWGLIVSTLSLNLQGYQDDSEPDDEPTSQSSTDPYHGTI